MTATSQTAPASMAVLPRQRRLPLAQLLFAAAGVALLVVGGAYVLRFVAATAFHKERAFRVLDEIGGQFDNLQRTLTNQLRLMPSQLAGQSCVREFQGVQPAACSKRRENYQKRLALQGPVVGAATVSRDVFTKACAHVNRYGATLRAREPAVPFTVFACSAATLPSESGELSMVAFQGSMTETIEGFLSQEFFDEVLVALGDGTVIATVSRRNGKMPGVHLHAEKPQRLGVADVAAILRKVRDAPASSSSAQGPSATALPSQPEIFALRIADDNYRAFVRAVQPRYGMYVEQDGAKEAVRQDRLYLVGLKREDLRTELGSSMGPGGRFLLTVLTLLAFLIWPLANLRAKSPDDPITWTEAVACLASVVLIPAVLAIAAVWVWSYQGLLAWTDAGAQRYAREIEAVLGHELQNDRRLLTQYRAIYDRSGPEGPLGAAGRIDVPIRYEAFGENGAANVIRARASTEGCGQGQPDGTCVLTLPQDRPAGEYGLWSPLASVFSTNAVGIREGLRFTVYDPPQVKADASYDNREYFRALRSNAGWTFLDSRANGGTDAYVAQRIFSGGDGSRVLQVAVPRSGVCGSAFCGIVSASASVHSLSAAVSPPLLSFAVIDRNSGLVIFHSDDSRSLAENFFVETERNSELLALRSVAQSGTFSGHYMGTGHRFHHLPMTQAPWSVVVFYSLRDVGDLPWHAVFTALAAYAGALLILLVGSGLVVWLWAKRNRETVLNIAAGFWVRAGSSCSYARWALGLFGVALCLITLYELWADGPVSLITQVMWALFALASVAVLVQHRFAQHGACITIWLLLLSGIPAAWMALGYHDVQVQGLLRDGLVGAARDIERRHAAIANDLRRWLAAGEAQTASFPDPWSLTKPSAVMPVPGYAIAPGAPGAGYDVWAMRVFDAPPLGTLITHRELDFWRRETWDAAVKHETQQRRIRLLGRMTGWNPSCASEGAAEQCDFRMADGHTFAVRAQPTLARSGVLIEDDDTRFVNFASVTGNVAAVLLALAITWMLSLFITRRLLGDRLAKHTHGHVLDPAYRVHHSFVFHSRRLQGEEVERLIRDLRPGSGATPPSVKRVNLATKALYTELTPDHRIEGRVLLTNLDIALADAGRRQHILDALERLVDDPNVELLILCRRSPIDRLYHPQRYPESGAAHMLAVEESLRWDNVLQKFECRNVENVDRPRTHPHLSTVDHHRTWKLCTRSERLLLYELARGRLANPRNTEVIDALLARGLLKLDPWPKVADESFAAFVRTAETTSDVAQWQQDATRLSGGRWRSTLVAVVLVTVLLTVLWFSWSAGDTFKIVSTVVAGAVAFLGHIGQAFNFVRTNTGGARGG